MFETLKNAFKTKEIRMKMLFTFLLILVYRVGCFIPVPGFSASAMSSMLDQLGESADFIGILSMITGGSLSQASLFSLGILPFINAFIIMQLLTLIIPKLEKLSKEGDAGRRKITQITRYLALVLAAVQAIGVVVGWKTAVQPLFGFEESAETAYLTMTLIVMDTDKQACADKANRLLETLNSLGYTGFIETENSVEAWRGTLPGCYKCNIRRPIVSSLNFCHMAPTTAVWSGDKNNEHLKGPVLLYTDSSGYTPFRLSLHDGDVGHTLIVGPSGSGKSVLLNTLEAHFQKYANSNVFIFDKAASSRALTYAVGGHFYNLAAEGMQDLSFQPLAHIDDEKEMKWAKEWIMAYLVQKNVTVTPLEEIYVWNALKSLSVMPQEQRTLTVFTEFVQSHEIRQALQALTAKGSYGKLFDNNKEFSGTGSWQVYEMETLMQTPGIVAPTLDYLFHRIETRISKASGPSLIVLDECWLFLDNPIFQAKLKEYFKDMRKKSTSIWIATQQLSDIASKPALMDTVNDQCKHKIFLPNGNATSDANKDLYRIFGCNTRQTDIISKMTPKQDYYYSDRDKGNRLFRLALQPSELPFVTATSKTDQIKMDQIIMAGKQDDFIHEWLSYKNADEEWEKYQAYQKRYASPSPAY